MTRSRIKCPFCGKVGGFVWNFNGLYAAKCDSCYAEGPQKPTKYEAIAGFECPMSFRAGMNKIVNFAQWFAFFSVYLIAFVTLYVIVL